MVCEPAARSKSDGSFIQSVRLMDGEQVLAQARWQVSGEAAQGVAQLLELTVAEGRRRQGHGRRVMDAMTAQVREHFSSRKVTLRRVWVAIDQKRQVIGRSFLMQFGFNHVGTIGELLRDEDLLVYMRTFD
jgi:GNAT superfamily N-acetyltransferase